MLIGVIVNSLQLDDENETDSRSVGQVEENRWLEKRVENFPSFFAFFNSDFHIALSGIH